LKSTLIEGAALSTLPEFDQIETGGTRQIAGTTTL
jgi:hypothetical protein